MTFDLGRHKTSGSNRAKQGLPKRQNVLEDGSEFGSCLIKAGASLQRNADGILLDKDPSSFKQQLSKSLKLHLDYPAIIDEAVLSISKHLKDENVLRTFLKPVLLKDEDETSTFGLVGLNDSFLKIMLNIEVLQHKLMVFLLEKVVSLSKKEDNESMCLSIVKQFCWLDIISKPEDVVVKLFETVKDCPQSVQQGIISSLPEIIDDKQHSQVAGSLLDLMSSNPHLLLTIIDALDNLNLPDDCLQEMKQSVTDMLASAEIEELPVVLKFLFQHISVDDAFQVVQKIRKNVKLSCDLSTRPTSTPLIKAVRKKEASRDAFALVIESLKPLPFHKAVANAWLKAIEELKDIDEVQPVDIFVLLILHSCDEQKKAVENVVRNKVTSGVVTSANMKEAFSIRPEIMEDFFKSIMQLAELFFKSPFQVITKFACSLYKTSFAELNSYCQQEIIGTLVSHIGSGCPSKIDLMLDALVDLVGDHLDMMVPYSAFINGILDYLDNLDLIQVKKLYQVLGKMAYCSRHGSDMQEGLNIVITKQLSSHVLRYQQIGVVGGLMVVMNLSMASSGEDSNVSLCMSRSSRTNKKSDDNSQQVKDMLELIQSNAERSPQLMALFFEELAVLMRSKCLDRKVENWISDKVEQDFQMDFVVDLKDGLSTNEGTCRHGELVWEVQFMLDELGPDDDDFAINVASLVAKETSLSGTRNCGRSSLWCLSSCFRLLHTCCSSLKENNLEDIDALLGCGIKLPKCFPTTADQLESSSDKERVVRLHSAFAVVNWFRELLNSFSSQEKEQMRSKVIARLRSIVALHCLIERMLFDYPDYIPPPNIYSSNPEQQTRDLVLLPKKSRTSKAAKEKSTKAGRGRKRPRKSSNADVTLNEDATSNLNITIDCTAVGGANVSKAANDNSSNKSSTKNTAINRPLLSNYFRELDMEVFQILSFTKLNSPGVVDDEFSEKQLKLEASSLVFLLEDLLTKLNHCLSKSSERRTSFLKTKNESNIMGFNNLNLVGSSKVANKVCDLIPHLCRYMESLSGYFQVTRDKQNETCDLSCFEFEENIVMGNSILLLIKILLAFFSWSELSSDKRLLKNSVTHISDRIAPSSSLILSERFRQAFDYIEKFGRSVQDISSAVHLSRLLSCLSVLSDSRELQTKAGEVALTFLKQKWKEEEKKADSNMAVAMLLNTSFKHSSDIQALIEVFISSAIPEFLKSQDSSETFPTLNKDTLPVYYKLLMFYLVENSKTITPGNKDTPLNENVDKMLRWEASVMDFRVLIDLIKTHDSRSNLTSALKYGRKFVDLFMRQCIPTFDFLFVSHKDEIQALFKTLQLSTRALHHLCSHLKIKKDVSLTNQVPQLKRTLESLIHRVKDMLNKNKCVAAFWLGNLKNRNLKGEELLSQEYPPSDSDDDDYDNERAGGKKGKVSDDCGILVEDGSVDGQDGASVEGMDLCYNSDVRDDDEDDDI